MSEGQAQVGSSVVGDLLERLKLIPVLRHVAHDLNNSVWSVLANMEIVALLGGSENEQLSDVLASMKQGIERASEECRYANSVLKQVVAERDQLELTNVVAEGLELIRPSVPEHIDLVVDNETLMPRVRANYIDVLILLHCLMENSIAAIGEDSGRIEIGFEREDTFAVMSVSDSGAGFQQDQVPIIQAAMDSIDKSHLGLGLIAVAETMYSLRGKIELNSEFGKGTTFRLRFPETREES
ncbi:MAG: HAMP domain-containing histidine kinase [Planctomycetales bacterium]|nr:HAMP domain-containing histidine kinase [Planctomycetales bacterium]